MTQIKANKRYARQMLSSNGTITSKSKSVRLVISVAFKMIIIFNYERDLFYFGYLWMCVVLGLR